MTFVPFTDEMRKSVRKPRERNAGKPMSERNLQLILSRQRGATFAQLESEFGITRVRCRQICKAAGLPSVGRGRRRRNESEDSRSG